MERVTATYGAFGCPRKSEFRAAKSEMDASAVDVSIASLGLHITADRLHMKALKQHVLQVDVAQFCWYDTKTDQVADKRCNAQLLLSVDETDCELGVVELKFRLRGRGWGRFR